MDTLRVRVYNVLFGDGILVSFPERTADGATVTRHLLIDVGNVQSGEAGNDQVFEPIVRDILDVLDGHPLDLYVMTHEHMDHVQGLLTASKQFGLDVKARFAWLTGSSAKDYYDRHPEAEKQKKLALAAYMAIDRFIAAAPDAPEATNPLLHALMLNNNPKATADCVDHLRTVAGTDHTTYVFRGCNLEGTHPFEEAKLTLWAPEEDTSEYYGQFQPMALGVVPASAPGGKPSVTLPIPPAGVDAGAFYDLVDIRRNGFVDNLLAIDKSANNTSIVFCLEWRGWKLLFPGDAEQRSWKTMNKRGVLENVDFLKVGHHGSANGTPDLDLLDKILPSPPATDPRPRAVVSTCQGAYNNVPDSETLAELRKRCDLQTVEDLPADKLFLDILFEART